LIAFAWTSLVCLGLIGVPSHEIEAERHDIGGFFDFRFPFDVEVGLRRQAAFS
jgi:hypothetical protein